MIRTGFICAFFLTLSAAFAQDSDVSVTLGFSGEIVANTWNPLRISLRDQGAAEFTLEIDQGNLRDGEQLVHYRAPLAGGSGVSIFEDDLYIPAWRRLTWAIRTPERVLASGSVDRRRVDPRPLHLLGAVDALPNRLGREARVVDVRPDTLPERSSAYAGVTTLLVSDASVQAVASAAAAGVSVTLLEPLSEGLGRLAPAPADAQRLGLGWLTRVEDGAAPGGAEVAELPRLGRDALLSALISPDMQRGPQGVPQQVIFLSASVYALAALLVVRFGRVPGLFAGLSLALLFAAGAWGYLRPGDATLTRSRSLTLAGGPDGGLAQTLELRTLFSLPEGTRQLSLDAYPLELTSWHASPDGLRFTTPRWSAATLALAPRLESATFYWEGDELVNSGSAPLGDLFVMGLGQQPALATGERLNAQMRDSLPPATYTPLLPHLPRGSALARSGGHLYVALPSPSGEVLSSGMRQGETP